MVVVVVVLVFTICTTCSPCTATAATLSHPFLQPGSDAVTGDVPMSGAARKSQAKCRTSNPPSGVFICAI